MGIKLVKINWQWGLQILGKMLWGKSLIPDEAAFLSPIKISNLEKTSRFLIQAMKLHSVYEIFMFNLEKTPFLIIRFITWIILHAWKDSNHFTLIFNGKYSNFGTWKNIFLTALLASIIIISKFNYFSISVIPSSV